MSDAKNKSFYRYTNWKEVAGSMLQASHASNLYQPWLENSLSALIEKLSAEEDPRLALQQYNNQLSRWQKTVDELVEQLDQWNAYRDRKMRREPEWWDTKKTELNKVFEQNAREATKQWLLLFAGSLAEWNLSGCQWLLDRSWPFPAEFSFVPLMIQDGLAALQKDNLQEASDMLEFFLEPWIFEPGEFSLAVQVRIAFLLLLGRSQPQKGTQEKTLALFEQARDLPSPDGRALSALAHISRFKSETEKARELFQQAIRAAPHQPEAYAGMGMLLDDQKAWESARSWYAEAADRALRYPDPISILERLKTPVNGNLYYSLAVALEEISLDWSLQACEKALAIGMNGAGEYPDAEAYDLKGSLLEKLGRSSEAALAKYESGRRYGWDNELERSTEVLREALGIYTRINSPHQGTLFYLSEFLRLQAADPANDADKRVALALESLAFWEQGIRMENLSSNFYWVYLDRALINELLPGSSELTDRLLKWESLFFVERYLLFDDMKAFAWSYLGRFFRTLNLQANNEYALDHAFELNPNDAGAQEEKLIRLCNWGKFDEAMSLLEPRLQDEKDVWASSVKGFICMHQFRFEEALALTEANKQENWVRNVRGLSYLKLDEKEKAQLEFRALLDNQVNQPEDYVTYAWAITLLNLLDPEHAPDINQAIRLALRAAENENNLFEPLFNLGIALLVKGDDMQQAATHLKECVSYANNQRELRSNIDISLDLMKQLVAPLYIAEQATQIIDETIDLMREQLENVDRTRWAANAYDELHQQLIKLLDLRAAAPDGETIKLNRAIMAAQFGIARMALRASDWQQAATIYLNDLSSQEIPEVTSGRVKALSGWIDAACKALDSGQFSRTADLITPLLGEPFASALRDLASELPWQPGALAGLLASARLGAGEQELALDALTSAVEEAAAASEGKSVMELGIYLAQHIANMRHYWQLDDALSVLASRNDFAAVVRRGLRSYLVRSYQMDAPITMYPLVTPIAVEIGQSLIPNVPDNEWPVIRDYVPEMRNRITKSFGVILTGTRFRGNEGDLPADAYIILLHEVPLIMGTAYSGKEFCLATSEKLLELGIPADAFSLIDYPFKGAWLEPEHGQVAREQGLEVWQDPAYFMCRHLEVFLTRNLEGMLLYQDVENLLTKLSQPELISAALPDDTARLRFTRLLRALLHEYVPITRLEDILEAVQAIGLPEDDITPTMEYVRCQLKSSLPGNQSGVKLITVPSSIEDAINGYVRELGGKTSFVIPPEETQELLSQLREIINSNTEPSLAIVVQQARIRPYMRRLIELEFDHIPVMSRDEISLYES